MRAMRCVWKYPLNGPGTITDVEIPGQSSIVHVAAQNGVITLWADVYDTSSVKSPRRFSVVGTGQQPAPLSRYVGTCIHAEFVWHVYEELGKCE